MVSERRKAFAVAHYSDKDRQTYISTCLYASSVIAKAEAWQATCSSLSPKSVYFFLHFVVGFFSTSLTSPTVSLSGSRLRSSPII